MSLFLWSCAQEKALTADEIIQKAIVEACSGNCDSAEIAFTFRKLKYRSVRQNGQFSLQRSFTDSLGSVRDELTNDGFRRYRNDSLVKVADTMVSRYAESVNSVHYFAQLPYGLNAPAVNAELLGTAIINDQPYYEIGITFDQEGGGTDYEDEFVYWIHKENFHVDYLAYKYAVNGGGIRFREAYNPRKVQGIRFVDYNNYKPESLNVELIDLDRLFLNDALQLLSKIETEEVAVKRINTTFE